ncbi:MAG: hypothetical protein AAF500_03410 [Myxococcota bacterium]
MRWTWIALACLIGCGSSSAPDAGIDPGGGGAGGEPARAAPEDSCEAFCGTSCPSVFGISLSIFNFSDCVIQCRETQLGNDGCGDVAQAFIECLEQAGCSESRAAAECGAEEAVLTECNVENR